MRERKTNKQIKEELAEIAKTGKKKCTVCKEMLPLNMFQKQSSKRLGLKYKCKKCAKKFDHKRYLSYKQWVSKLCEKNMKDNMEKHIANYKERNSRAFISYSMDRDEEQVKHKIATDEFKEKWEDFKNTHFDHTPTIVKMGGMEERLQKAKEEWERMKKEQENKNNLENPL